MGLLRNGIYGYKVAGNATLLGSRLPFTKNFATNTLTWQTDNREFTSFPSGLSQSSFHMPLKYGAMRMTITGRGDMSAGIIGAGQLTANLTGSGNILQGELNAGRNLQVTLTGGGDLIVADIEAPANLECIIRIGANPSAFDIAQAIWGAIADQNDQTGTMGEKLNSAGGAADPWGIDIVSGGYTGNQAGKKLKDASDDAFAASVKP